LGKLTDHLAKELDEQFKRVSAGIAAGWPEGWDADRGNDATSSTWKERATQLAETVVTRSAEITFLVPRLAGFAVSAPRWLLGIGLGLVFTSAPSWILYGLVLLTLTPRCGSLHLWGCEVIGRPLVFALGRVIDVARCALCLVINVALSVTLTPARAASKSMPAPTLRCATGNNRPGCKGPRPVSRRARRDALAEWVRGLEAEARELDAARAEDSKWLCGEARACEGHAAEVFEAQVQGSAGETVGVWVVRRDHSRALCVTRDLTKAFVVARGSVRKAEAPPARERVGEVGRDAGSDLHTDTPAQAATCECVAAAAMTAEASRPTAAAASASVASSKRASNTARPAGGDGHDDVDDDDDNGGGGGGGGGGGAHDSAHA
jgi:hypothetical protein